MPQTIDLTFLTKMMEGDEKLVARFLSIFRTQSPVQLQDLILHFENRQWAEVSNVAHGMKTQFIYLSMENLAGYAKEIEQLADEGKTEHIGEPIRHLEEELTALLHTLA